MIFIKLYVLDLRVLRIIFGKILKEDLEKIIEIIFIEIEILRFFDLLIVMFFVEFEEVEKVRCVWFSCFYCFCSLYFKLEVFFFDFVF